MTATQLDLLATPEPKYQPRWLAWCEATGQDPANHTLPTYKFIIWISQNLAAWRELHGVDADAWMTPAMHDSFTAYLFEISAAARPAAVTDPAAGFRPLPAAGSSIATSGQTPPASTQAPGPDVSLDGSESGGVIRPTTAV